MRPLLTILIVLIFGFFLGGTYERHLAQPLGLPKVPSKPEVSQVSTPQAKKVERLEQYFKRYHSPLASQAAYLVGTANLHRIDYRLLPAIATVESTACRFYIRSTFNCFGWGSGVLRFENYETAEQTIAKALSKSKTYRSYQATRDILSLARVYNGGNYQEWGNKVERVMEEIAR